MTVTAIIPARGGSKGVPGKNLKAVGGRSLVGRAILSCRGSANIDHVVVSTDSSDIAAEAERYGAHVIRRPDDLSGDGASSESALVHAIEVAPDLFPADGVLVFVQCTSPFISSTDVANAVRRVENRERDVVFSAVRSHGFLWADAADGIGGVNHDSRVRLRRQERSTEYLETGAFYAMRVDGFLDARHRFFGRVGVELVDEAHSMEIDSPTELAVAVAIAETVDPLGTAGLPVDDVDVVVMDFDGVHTDNTATVREDGLESATVNRSDGMGISHARDAGLAMLILSTEKNPIVERRAAKLGVECISGCDDKWATLQHWLDENGHRPERTVYIGNDVNDRECLNHVGFPVIVRDAHPLLHATSAHVTSKRGGNGVVREVIDALLGSTRAQRPETGDDI